MPKSTSSRTAGGVLPTLDLQNIFDNAPVGIFSSTPEGRYISANPATASMLGYESPEDLIESVTDIATQVYADPADKEEFMRLMEEQGEVCNHECRFRRKDGTELWVSRNVRAVWDEDGRIVAYQGFNTDITERKRHEEALRESEKKHRLLFETMAQGVVYEAADGAIISANPAAERILGLSFDQMRGKTPMDPGWRMIKEDGTEVPGRDQPCMVALRTGETVGPVVRGVFHPGRKAHVWLSITAIPLFQPGEPKPFQAYATFEDITERKQAGEALIESEALFRGMFKDHSAVMLLIDPDTGQIVEANQAAAHYYGYPLDHMIQMKIQQLNVLTPAEISKKMGSAINKQVNIFEFRHLLADEQLRDVEVHSTPITIQNQTLLFSIIHDITERKRAEEALRNERAVLRSIIDSIPVMITRYDPNIKILFLNKEFEKKIGWKTEEIRDINLMEEVYPDPAYRKIVKEYMEKAVSEWREFSVTAKSGAIVFSEWSNTCLDDGTQIGIGIDITERKQAEAEREKLLEQFRQAQKMESIGLLAGGIAHDFNNMLGVILGYSEMALEQVPDGHPIYKAVHKIQEAAQRSADLTRQLLAFARKQPIAPRVIDLNETVAGMHSMLHRLIGEDIALIWLPVGNLCPVKIDPAQIDQILANLCVNARDAIEGPGKVTIETGMASFDEAWCAVHTGAAPGEYVLLMVRDSGRGMDQETISHLFEPFFTTKEQGQGTGLGLASVYGAVTQNNGFITVDSEPGQGTIFTIYLPRYTETRAEPLPQQVPVEVAARGHETILLVEDEPATLDMTSIMLERQGYTVLAAGSPKEAIRLAGEYSGRIDLLVTDVVMPGMNGRALTENLLTRRPDIKCLFMSGYTADIIAHHGVLDQDIRFIQKPFSLKELGTKLREVMDE
ncbi:hybrid sensor histidine kinase/response regulator [Desulfobulbus alkaliphilus]|uniref:hybrid sensor histidine kinase/response regulator n=1 Tax=Desulfobulbus alkaliphilus TaxID=869814 RepID=UPI00196572F3|nr:PAS domain-containing sensor histidine kinase [Desulfobulbus alkaliphilus]MBM9537905.1 PAS domain S-box protein [Desulfobulbus alkaliphilus]